MGYCFHPKSHPFRCQASSVLHALRARVPGFSANDSGFLADDVLLLDFIFETRLDRAGMFVDPVGFEPATSSVRLMRAPSCATGPDVMLCKAFPLYPRAGSMSSSPARAIAVQGFLFCDSPPARRLMMCLPIRPGMNGLCRLHHMHAVLGKTLKGTPGIIRKIDHVRNNDGRGAVFQQIHPLRQGWIGLQDLI